MLVAPKKPAGPEWLEVSGAKVLFAPITRPMVRRARRAALKKLGREDEAETEFDAVQQLEDLGDALSEAMIMEGVQDWADVGDQVFDEDGDPVLDSEGKETFTVFPFSKENLAVLLSDHLVFEAFDKAYVVPYAQRERAKNGSAVSLSGIGEAATRASNTASSRVQRRAAGGAKSARTKSKPPRTTKPKRSGKS